MPYKAHVWLTRRPGEGRIDLGIIDVDPSRRPPHQIGHYRADIASRMTPVFRLNPAA